MGKGVKGLRKHEKPHDSGRDRTPSPFCSSRSYQHPVLRTDERSAERLQQSITCLSPQPCRWEDILPEACSSTLQPSKAKGQTGNAQVKYLVQTQQTTRRQS